MVDSLGESIQSVENHRKALWVLLIVFFVFWFLLPLVVPRFSYWIYLLTMPFRLLAVFVHEMGHGLSTLLSGGRFLWFQMDYNGGVAVTSGGLRIFTLLGGLLAPALMGALLLQASTKIKQIQWVTLVLGAFFLIGVYYMIKPLFLSSSQIPDLQQWSSKYLLSLVIPGTAALLSFRLLASTPGAQRYFLQILGILMCYSGFSDRSYIFRFQPLNQELLVNAPQSAALFSDSRVVASLFWPGGPASVPFVVFFITATVICILNFALLFWGIYGALKKA